MDRKNCCDPCYKPKCISKCCLIVLGIIFGIATTLLYYFLMINSVRLMIPYALAFGIIIFITTAVLICCCPYRRSICKYAALILITAAIFILFALVILAMEMSFMLNVILSFIGSTVFGIMLFAFIAMFLCILSQRCHCR